MRVTQSLGVVPLFPIFLILIVKMTEQVSSDHEILPLGAIQSENQKSGAKDVPQIISQTGEIFYEDPTDERLLIDPKGEKCILGPNGEKYVIDPNDERYVIGPDGKRYFIPKYKYLTDSNDERYIDGPNGEKYFADPHDDRYCIDSKGKKYLVGPNNELYPVNPKDHRYAFAPNGYRFIMGPNGEKYFAHHTVPNYVVGPEGDNYVVNLSELHSIFLDSVIPRSSQPLRPQKHPNANRVKTDEDGNKFVETPGGVRFYADPENYNFAKGPDGRDYIFPATSNYLVSLDGRRTQIVVPVDESPKNLRELPAGSTADVNPKLVGVEALPTETTIEKSVRNKLKAVTLNTLNLSKDLLNSTQVN